MGKPFKGKTLLSLVLVAIILILGLVLFNGCGQGNPAGSQTGTTAASGPGKNTPASTIPIALSSPPSKVMLSNASGAATITWNSYPGATTYNLYYSNTPDFSNSSKLAGVTSPYTFPFPDRQKDYYFFVTAGNGTSEQRISGDFASLYRNGTRFKMIHPMDPIYRLLKKQKRAAIFDLMERAYAELVDGSSILYTGGHLTSTFSNQYIINNESFFGIDCMQQQGGGGYIEYYAYGNYIAPNSVAVMLGGLTAGTFIGSAKYRYTDTGGYEYLGEEPSFAHIGISDSGASYDNDAPPLGNYFVWAWSNDGFCNSANECGTQQPPAILQVHVSNHNLAAYQTAYDSPSIIFDLIVSGITVSPASATIYIHHSDPAKKQQQFTAKDSNNVDVTNTAQWKIEPTVTTPPVTIANINAGLATPLKPGEASVTAALLDGSGNVTASGQANLEVMCRAYTAYSQNDPNWANVPYDHLAFETIGSAGCALTDMAMIISTSSQVLSNTTPPVLNTWMNNNGYYTSFDITINNRKIVIQKNGWVSWDTTINKYTNNSVQYVLYSTKYDPKTKQMVPLSNPFAPPTMLDGYLKQCNVIVALVKRRTTSMGFHWILVTGKKGNDFTVIDPWEYPAKNGLLSDYSSTIYGYVVYNYFTN